MHQWQMVGRDFADHESTCKSVPAHSICPNLGLEKRRELQCELQSRSSVLRHLGTTAAK